MSRIKKMNRAPDSTNLFNKWLNTRENELESIDNQKIEQKDKVLVELGSFSDNIADGKQIVVSIRSFDNGEPKISIDQRSEDGTDLGRFGRRMTGAESLELADILGKNRSRILRICKKSE